MIINKGKKSSLPGPKSIRSEFSCTQEGKILMVPVLSAVLMSAALYYPFITISSLYQSPALFLQQGGVTFKKQLRIGKAIVK